MPLLVQVIGKQPPPPSDGSGFQANGPVDMRHLTELALVAGATAADYSNEQPDTFTITRAGIDFVIDGSFTYTGGLPDAGGTVNSITVNADRYEIFAPFNFTVAQFDALFATANPLTIISTLLAGDNPPSAHGEIKGSGFGDSLYGFGGQDLIGAGLGGNNNRLHGGAGNDSLSAGGGNDSMYGGPGNDLFSVPGGDVASGVIHDYIDGGTGNDTLNFYSGGFSALHVALNGSHPSVATVGANITLTLVNIENIGGTTTNDRLIGDSHKNALYGFGGNDTISGGAGNDSLDGGHGHNLLSGGPGRDSFVFDSAMIGGFAGDTPRSTVTDFHAGIDRIVLDIQIFDSLTYTGTLSPANFLAAPHAVYGHNGQQFLVYDTVTGNLYYDPTGMGPSPTFHEIAHLDHAPKLHASDIHLIMQEFLIPGFA